MEAVDHEHQKTQRMLFVLLQTFALVIAAQFEFITPFSAFITITLVIATYYAYSSYMTNRRRSKYNRAAINKKLALNKKHKCFDDYNKLVKSKPKIESFILSMTATQIRENIINEKMSCAEVMLIICYNTEKQNEKLNAILEKHYDNAYKDAIELDQLISTKRNTKNKQEWLDFIDNKPLLGIPISIKDLFQMKNSDSTCGLVRLCNKPYTNDGKMLQLIRKSGAIPYVKTNCPQLNMLPETVNHIIGHTNNPYNTDCVSGGSSGGEAALISCGVSKLGIGTDIGGSLRSPANWSGCIAYKPSSKRSPQTGKALQWKHFYCNKASIVSSTGPMAAHMDDIIRFLRMMWSSKNMYELDCYMAPIPFRENIFNSKRKLKIGYWFDDGWFTSAKCVKRAINEVVCVLKQEYEYELIPLKFDLGSEVIKLYFQYMGAEGKMKDYMYDLQDTEELFHGFKRLRFVQQIPVFFKKYIINPILYYIGEYRTYDLSHFIPGTGLSVTKYKKVTMEIMKFKYEFYDKYFNGNDKIDCIIAPTNFYPAPKHNFSTNFTPTLTSTFLQNILDCSAGNYGPVAFVNKKECHYLLNDLPKYQQDRVSKMLHGYMKSSYGLPIGVQIFSKPFDDEIVLRVMNDLDIYYKKNKPRKPYFDC
eukprot:223851_1